MLLYHCWTDPPCSCVSVWRCVCLHVHTSESEHLREDCCVCASLYDLSKRMCARLKTGTHSGSTNTEQSRTRDDIYDLSHSATCFPKRRPFKCHICSGAPPSTNDKTEKHQNTPLTEHIEDFLYIKIHIQYGEKRAQDKYWQLYQYLYTPISNFFARVCINIHHKNKIQLAIMEGEMTLNKGNHGILRDKRLADAAGQWSSVNLLQNGFGDTKCTFLKVWVHYTFSFCEI